MLHIQIAQLKTENLDKEETFFLKKHFPSIKYSRLSMSYDTGSSADYFEDSLESFILQSAA
jgi:hypothetical protein